MTIVVLIDMYESGYIHQLEGKQITVDYWENNEK